MLTRRGALVQEQDSAYLAGALRVRTTGRLLWRCTKFLLNW
jgi:hypothetical protein